MLRGRELSYWVSTADGVLVDLAKAHAISIPALPPNALERPAAFVVQAAFGQGDRWDLARFDSEEEAQVMLRKLASCLGASGFEEFLPGDTDGAGDAVPAGEETSP